MGDYVVLYHEISTVHLPNILVMWGPIQLLLTFSYIIYIGYCPVVWPLLLWGYFASLGISYRCCIFIVYDFLYIALLYIFLLKSLSLISNRFKLIFHWVTCIIDPWGFYWVFFVFLACIILWYIYCNCNTFNLAHSQTESECYESPN